MIVTYETAENLDDLYVNDDDDGFDFVMAPMVMDTVDSFVQLNDGIFNEDSKTADDSMSALPSVQSFHPVDTQVETSVLTPVGDVDGAFMPSHLDNSSNHHVEVALDSNHPFDATIGDEQV